QVDSMNRTATEMQLAAQQAQAELDASNVQVTVARTNYVIAQLNLHQAWQVLTVVNDASFTPDTWRAMGDVMHDIYQHYMGMALQVALLMQQAYNFENDTFLRTIKTSYTGLGQGLMAADSLMADIQSFTYNIVTDVRGKKQLLKTTISLAE